MRAVTAQSHQCWAWAGNDRQPYGAAQTYTKQKLFRFLSAHCGLHVGTFRRWRATSHPPSPSTDQRALCSRPSRAPAKTAGPLKAAPRHYRPGKLASQDPGTSAPSRPPSALLTLHILTSGSSNTSSLPRAPLITPFQTLKAQQATRQQCLSPTRQCSSSLAVSQPIPPEAACVWQDPPPPGSGHDH